MLKSKPNPEPLHPSNSAMHPASQAVAKRGWSERNTSYQQSRFISLDPLCQRLLNVNCTTDTVLSGAKGKLNLQGRHAQRRRRVSVEWMTQTVVAKSKCTGLRNGKAFVCGHATRGDLDTHPLE